MLVVVPMEEGRFKECAFAPLLFKIFLAAVIHVALTLSGADKNIMDALVVPGEKHERWTECNNGRRASPGEVILEYAIC